MTSEELGFGIYVHWPFCVSKCPYCDFNSHVRASIDEAAWRDALVGELAHMAELAPGRTVTSIFFGGGTPSLMNPATVAAVLDAVPEHWSVAADVEITLEANPGSVEAGRFAGYRAAGVNRVSLGVRALDDNALRALGRQHNEAQALAAIEIARNTFPSMSFDLIYARMGQTPESWRDELIQALLLGTDHLSLYQLTIEPGTQFHTLARRGALDLPNEDAQADMYETTQVLTDAAGLNAYEISNHAKTNARSRHNTTYWRSGEWVGVGPGAHGRINEDGGVSIQRRQERAPETWLAACGRDGHATAETETIEGEDRLAEVLMMGMRLVDGLSDHDMRRAAGRSWNEAVDPETLGHLVETGMLERDVTHVRATAQGRQVLNSVLSMMLA